MDRGQVSRIVAAGYAAAALLVLTGSPNAFAGSMPEDGWAHRSTQTVSPDGFAVRSTQAPRQVSPDGFAVRSQSIGQDGWAAASVELPESSAIQDGWAARTASQPIAAVGTDGWSYAAVEGDEPGSIARTEPAPSRTSSPSPDYIGFGAVLAAAAVAGVMFEVHRRHLRHHLPI